MMVFMGGDGSLGVQQIGRQWFSDFIGAVLIDQANEEVIESDGHFEGASACGFPQHCCM